MKHFAYIILIVLVVVIVSGCNRTSYLLDKHAESERINEMNEQISSITMEAIELHDPHLCKGIMDTSNPGKYGDCLLKMGITYRDSSVCELQDCDAHPFNCEEVGLKTCQAIVLNDSSICLNISDSYPEMAKDACQSLVKNRNK